jgi:ribosomal protein S3AE
MFEGKEICEVVASDDKRLINRVVRTSLLELGLAGGASQMAMFTTLRFRIKDINGADANTMVLGHEIAPSFIKTFARRGKSLIHQVVDEKTKDNEDFRLKIVAVTGARVSANTRRNLRNALVEECKKAIVEKTFDEAFQDVIYGRVSSRIFGRLKQITKMRRVEVRKSERGEIFKN